MITISKGLLDLTAGDVMKDCVEPIAVNMKLPQAAELLRRGMASEAPVVDADGRCIGVLSATAFVFRPKGCSQRETTAPIRSCLFQKKGALASGEEAVLCTLTGGYCPLQVHRTTLEGDDALFCLEPHCVLVDWQQVVDDVPDDEVSQHMNPRVPSVRPATHLTRVARMMADSRLHRVYVLDSEDRPVGIITMPDVLAAVANLESAPPRWAGG